MFGCLEAVNWAHWGLSNWAPIDIGQPEKTLLSPYRIASMLCVAYLVFSSDHIRMLCNRRWMRPLALCGRYSLPVFAAGCVLAYSSRFALAVLGTGWLVEAAINLVGVGATFALALGLEQHRLRGQSRPPTGPAFAALPVAPV